ncbi:MAG: YcgL domain-containing protein [Gammaproteobacteria bacterium]|nr:YcgL domain-containing protein [Gammaproteobacteria bacterium]
MNVTSVPCTIYRSAKKADSYLYVERENEFARVPQALLDMLGPLTLVMSLELHSRRKLAQVDVTQVMAQLQQQGYFLQMPPGSWQQMPQQ